MANIKDKINVVVTFKDGVSQHYRLSANTNVQDRFIRLWYNDKEFLFNSDVIERIEVLSEELVK